MERIKFSWIVLVWCWLLAGQVAAAGRMLPPRSLNGNQSVDCDFEASNLCSWTGSLKVTTPRSLRDMYSPLQDHTMNTLDGHFAYVYAHDSARLDGWLQTFTPFRKPDAILCFEFAYYFYAEQPSIMSLNLDSQTDSVTIYRAYGANTIQWREARISVNNSDFKPYDRFKFRITVASGILALDDIKLRQKPCFGEDLFYTDFEMDEHSVKMLHPIAYTDPKWEVFVGRSFPGPGIPDHTVRTSAGHFYGIDQGQNNRNHVFVVESKTFTASTCLRFSYYMRNVAPSTRLFIMAMPAGQVSNQVIWKVAGNTSNMWFTHQQRIRQPDGVDRYTVQIGINTMGSQNRDLVFIDDVWLFETNYCNHYGRCDFEDGDMCLLEPVMPTTASSGLTPEQKYEFTKTKNGTKFPNRYLNGNVDVSWHVFTPHQSERFIDHDATTKRSDGKYLLLTSSRGKNDRGVFVTGRYDIKDSNQSLCISFSVFKPSAGDVLEIYQDESFGDNEFGTKIWDVRGAVGKDWTTFEVYAQSQNLWSIDLFFYFVGTITDSRSYIAIDDFLIKRHCEHPSNDNHGSTTTPNPANYFQCHSGLYIPLDKVCDWKKDCPDGDDETHCGTCDFRPGQLCNYTVENPPTGEQYGFSLANDSNADPFASGRFFMKANGSPFRPVAARIISPIVHQTYTKHCRLSFFYSFEGSNNDQSFATVHIYRLDLGENVLVWQSNAQALKSSQWQHIDLDLNRIHHPFALIFTAHSDQSSTGYHAVGDIRLVNCHPEEPSVCSESEFRCRNKVCIKKRYVCDLEDDCGDESDEQDCDPYKLTDFEDNFGSWGRGVNIDWKRIEAKDTDNLKIAPPYDHTTGLSSGRYIYVNKIFSTSAMMDGPIFRPTGRGCKLQFYMFKNTPYTTLTMELHDVDNNTIVRTDEINDAKMQFTRYEFEYPEAPFRYQIVLYGQFPETDNDVRNISIISFIALDDISFTAECQVWHPKDDDRQKRSNGWKIFFGITIPVVAVGLVIFYVRRNAIRWRIHGNIPMTMNGIQREN